MFYSDSLLAKTGPLARVWLAANLERKLTKQNILQSDIDNNVRDIMGTGQAPMALRLSGQLLLGVVRIYSRKARYLFDDCAEALSRLKMSFRPGNVDLPANQLASANAHTLTLPDAITEQDLLASLGGPDFFADAGMLDFEPTQSQGITSTPTSARRNRNTSGLELEDLGLELNFDEPSIEIGRRAQPALDDGPSLMADELDFGLNDTSYGQDDTLRAGLVDDVQMPDFDNIPGSPTAGRQRDTLPRQDTSFQLNGTALEEVDETGVQAAQRVKRRKVLEADVETELNSAAMKKFQDDRSHITRAPNFLPQDPFLLQLMEAQRSGAFVSSLLGDGRMLGLAPELRGICSIEVIRKVGEKKRKRDSGIADVETSSERASPRLDISLGEDEFNLRHDDPFADDPTLDHGPLVMDDEEVARIAGQDIDGPSTLGPEFDHTEAPLLHPSQSGPVSLGTKTAVAALRGYFAPDHKGTEPPTPSKRTRAEAKFSELCPIEQTNRADATKMFFELLVLGTKDAVKIEQEKGKGLDGEIRVRGKRGLWGSWAEVSTQGNGAVTTI